MHRTFTVTFNGFKRELMSEATITNPITKSSTKINRACWDTGASASAIRADIATKLGLVPTGQTKVHTANGVATVDTYIISLELPGSQVIFRSVAVSSANLGPNTEMLIGMDIIGHGDFIVQRHKNFHSFSFTCPPFENKFNMIEKCEKVNKRKSKKLKKI